MTTKNKQKDFPAYEAKNWEKKRRECGHFGGNVQI